MVERALDALIQGEGISLFQARKKAIALMQGQRDAASRMDIGEFWERTTRQGSSILCVYPEHYLETFKDDAVTVASQIEGYMGNLMAKRSKTTMFNDAKNEFVSGMDRLISLHHEHGHAASLDD